MTMSLAGTRHPHLLCPAATDGDQPWGLRLAAISIVAVGLLILGASVGAVPALGAPLAAACSRTQADGGWTRLVSPAFSVGPRLATAYAVASDGSAVYITNSSVILRTQDLGCHWEQVYAVDPGPQPEAQSLITRLATSPSGNMAAVYAVVDGPDGPTVHRSADSGTHWTRGSALPGSLKELVVGSRDPSILYAVSSGPAASSNLAGGTGVATATLLMRSADGGSTWSVVSYVGPSVGFGAASLAVTTAPRIDGLTLDPGDDNHLWLPGPDGLYESRDGGATRSVVAQAMTSGGVGATSASSALKGAANVVFALRRSPSVGFTSPGSSGTTRLSLQAVGAPLQSVAAGRVAGQFAIATARQVLLRLPDSVPGSPLIDVSPAYARLTELVPIPRSGNEFVVFGRSGNTVEFRAMVLSPSRTPAKTTDITGKKLPPNQSAILTLDLPPSAERTPTISPELMRIGLGAGGRRTVPYTLALPGSRKVDVYFLVDISASMKDKIRGVKMSLNKIVSDLQQAGVDPWFGVGGACPESRGTSVTIRCEL